MAGLICEKSILSKELIQGGDMIMQCECIQFVCDITGR